jgi:protein tyrosine/serine phosphatase
MDINTWNVRDEHVVRVLEIMRDRSRGPFLVRCQHSADRIALTMAMYCMVEQGWRREHALRETTCGYRFQATWRNLVRYVQRMNVAISARRAVKFIRAVTCTVARMS